MGKRLVVSGNDIITDMLRLIVHVKEIQQQDEAS
jgi:hypothetical protein